MATVKTIYLIFLGMRGCQYLGLDSKLFEFNIWEFCQNYAKTVKRWTQTMLNLVLDYVQNPERQAGFQCLRRSELDAGWDVALAGWWV